MTDTANGKSRLRLAREAEGLSRERAAAHIGISSKTLERYEKGVTPVPRFRLREFAKLYRVQRLSELERAA